MPSVYPDWRIVFCHSSNSSKIEKYSIFSILEKWQVNMVSIYPIFYFSKKLTHFFQLVNSPAVNQVKTDKMLWILINIVAILCFMVWLPYALNPKAIKSEPQSCLGYHTLKLKLWFHLWWSVCLNTVYIYILYICFCMCIVVF